MPSSLHRAVARRSVLPAPDAPSDLPIPCYQLRGRSSATPVFWKSSSVRNLANLALVNAHKEAVPPLVVCLDVGNAVFPSCASVGQRTSATMELNMPWVEVSLVERPGSRGRAERFTTPQLAIAAPVHPRCYVTLEVMNRNKTSRRNCIWNCHSELAVRTRGQRIRLRLASGLLLSVNYDI